MKGRLSVVLSLTALAIAVLAATPFVEAAGKATDRPVRAQQPDQFPFPFPLLGARWAVVRIDGSLGSARGVLSASRPATGQYVVRFRTDVSPCAWLATIGTFSGYPTEDRGYAEHIRTQAEPGQPNAVRVFLRRQTPGSAGDSPVNDGFHIAALC